MVERGMKSCEESSYLSTVGSTDISRCVKLGDEVQDKGSSPIKQGSKPGTAQSRRQDSPSLAGWLHGLLQEDVYPHTSCEGPASHVGWN